MSVAFWIWLSDTPIAEPTLLGTSYTTDAYRVRIPEGTVSAFEIWDLKIFISWALTSNLLIEPFRDLFIELLNIPHAHAHANFICSTRELPSDSTAIYRLCHPNHRDRALLIESAESEMAHDTLSLFVQPENCHQIRQLFTDFYLIYLLSSWSHYIYLSSPL